MGFAVSLLQNAKRSLGLHPTEVICLPFPFYHLKLCFVEICCPKQNKKGSGVQHCCSPCIPGAYDCLFYTFLVNTVTVGLWLWLGGRNNPVWPFDQCLVCNSNPLQRGFLKPSHVCTCKHIQTHSHTYKLGAVMESAAELFNFKC